MTSPETSPPAPSAGSGTVSPPSPPGLVRSAGLVSVATMASRLLGLVRDQALAWIFGAGDAMDAFNVAFRIPNLVRDLFAEGAMTSAFVPTFTRHLAQRGREQAWRLGNMVLNGLFVATMAIVLAGMIWAEPIVTLFAEDYGAVAGKLDLTVNLARIMFPFLTLVAVAVACMGMLNALGKFFLPALSPAMFNVASIFSAVALVPLMPLFGLPKITAIAIGVLLGGLGQIVIQWPLLRREGFRYRPVLDPRDEGLRQVLLLMVPGTVGLAAVQVNLLVNTVLATGEGTGAVSWLNYAFRLMYLPIGLLGVSVATVSTPRISQAAAAEDLAGLRATLAHALRLVFVLSVPSMVGLIVLARPIVALIFERGAFRPEDTEATAAALCFYAPGLLGYSAVKIAAPTFYALRDSRTPVAVSLASVGLNIALNVTLVGWIGFRGLALGTGIAALANAGLLLALLRRRTGGIGGRFLVLALAKVFLASAAMGVAAWVVEKGLGAILPGSDLLSRLVGVGGAIAVGVAVMALLARLLGIEEFNEATRLFLRKFRRRRPPATPSAGLPSGAP